MPRPYLSFANGEKSKNALVTTYLKNQCIFPVSTLSTSAGQIVLNGPLGTFGPYTTGYACLALNFKDFAGNKTLVQGILDIFAQIGAIKLNSLANAGSEYTNQDVLTLTMSAGGTAVTVTVNVDDIGRIVSYSGGLGGIGYPETGVVSTTGGTGSGATFNVYSDIMQQFAGWWYDQYVTNLDTAATTFQRITLDPSGRSGDLRVDSDAALLVWAMSDWDKLNGTTRYQTVVKKALDWLRSLQVSHHAAFPASNLVSNLVYQGVTDTTALTADCGECLLAMTRAMDAYGVGLTTSSGYSVQTMANDLYTSMTNSTVGFGGTANPIYRTSFPIGQNAVPPFNFNYVEPITYTQSICARANKTFVGSDYLTVADNSAQAELALDFTFTKMSGQWGGQFYTTFVPTNPTQTDQIEHVAYTAIMALGMQNVNSIKYAQQITSLKNIIQWMALTNGMILDQAHVDGSLWRQLLSGINVKPEVESYGVSTISIAQALLTGA